MKAIAIVGSPRRNGNTEILTRHALKAIEEEGISTELVSLAGKDIRPCNACMSCGTEEKCSIKDDLQPIYDKMQEADAVILATPVYFGSATGLLKSFMERTGYIDRRCKRRFAGKVGGPLVVARRAGHTFTLSQLLLWFQILGFVTPGSSTYWNIAFGREKKEVEKDEEGMTTAWTFGKNMAFVLKKLKS